MNAVSTATAAVLLAAAASVAAAQSTTQTPTQTGPSAASSPHQRHATDTNSNEAGTVNGANPGAASSPHQHEALENPTAAQTDEAMAAGATPATFVAKAAQSNLAEIELGKLAEKKASSDEVKQFAQRMVQDHTQANEQLASMAKSKGLTVPTKLDSKHAAIMKSMSAKSGEAFDSAYAENMAKSHEQAVALFQGAAKSSDPDVAAFAQKMLPTLEEHKQMADNIHSNTESRTASASKSHNK